MTEKSDIAQEMSDKNESSGSGIPFKKPRFVEKWLQDPKMSTWLRKQDGCAWCAVCEKRFEIHSHKSVLTKHAKSIHHKMNMHKQIEGPATNVELEIPKNETKALEIRYCLFAIEHNVSFETLQAFNKLNKSIIGSKVPSLRSIKLGKTKIRAIIKNVINKSLILDIQETVQEKYFSIIIDVKTDASNIKNLGVLIRFVNNTHLETHLLDLIAVKDATAENIFRYTVNSLNKFNLSLSKIVGIGVHNSLIIGCNNSLMTSFKDSNSEIVTFAYVEETKKLPYNDQFIKGLKFLNPQIALDHNEDVVQIEIIIETFPSKVVGTKVIDQWFSLATKLSADEKEKLKTLDVVEFWTTISNLKDELGNLLYDEVSKLAFICLSLPHTKLDMGRCFSKLRDIKNKEKNKLYSHELLCPLTRIKLYLKSKHIDACSFEISDHMLQCFNSEMYNKEQIPTEFNVIYLTEDIEESNSDIC